MRKHRVKSNSWDNAPKGGDILGIVKEVLSFHQTISMRKESPNARDNGMFLSLRPVGFERGAVQANERDGHGALIAHRETDAGDEAARGFNVRDEAGFFPLTERDPFIE